MKGPRGFQLEDYVCFFNSRDAGPLTRDQLNKIIRINGFAGNTFTKSRKADLLRTVELMAPSRSTVRECQMSSSSCAGLSLADVIKDIASIGWQECPIASIVTVNYESVAGAVEETAPISAPSSSGPSKKGRKGSGTTRKRKSVAPQHDLLLIGPVEETIRNSSCSSGADS